ncbi:MAG: mechanosensitive ion channel family protein [Chloroflexota bacterium]|nr:mechanosensitive ion channel family protein [Chloroflexota bacterium]
MLDEILTGTSLVKLISSLIALVGFVSVGIAFRLFAGVAIRRMESKASLSVPGIVLKSVQGPASLLLASIGLLLAYLIIIDIPSDLVYSIAGSGDLAIGTWQLVAIALGTLTTAHLCDSLIEWYLFNIASKTETTFDDTLLPTLRRVLPITIYAIGVLIAIDSFGVSVSPILAGLGIGGLAVALAVQPTLSNFFAGTYVVTEGELKKGDFIELEGGPSGYVEEVGWRSTKIRSRFNNLVIIPNSRMAESIVTNYYSPTPAMNVVVTCGVSYEADLPTVERCALEEAASLISESEQAIKDVTPFFGFSNFGDSNIDFFVFLQAIDRAGTFQLKSQLIKRIHQRFGKEGIEINYPVRRLVFPENKIDLETASDLFETGDQ